MKNDSQNAASGSLNAKSATAFAIKFAFERPILLIAAVSLIAGIGLYLNWPAIVGLGLAPLILMLAPCTLMCAVGLCGKSAGKGKAGGEPPARDDQP